MNYLFGRNEQLGRRRRRLKESHGRRGEYWTRFLRGRGAWLPALFTSGGGFRFLWTGVVLIILTCILGIVSINADAGLLYLLLGLLLGAWVISGLASSLNLAGLEVSRLVSATSQVGESLVINYRVTNKKRWFSSYAIVLEEVGHLPMFLPAGYAVAVAPGQSVICSVSVECRRRGHVRLRHIRVSSRFPFGLLAKCRVISAGADVVVHPALGRIRFELLNQPSSLRGGMGHYNQQTKGFEEFFGIREFQEHDNYHWIHWRSSAKLGRLMMREMAQYHSNRITILLDTRVADPLSVGQQRKLEEAISFAATLVDRATERSLPVALVITGEEIRAVRHGHGTGHRWELMTELARARMRSWRSELPSLGSIRPRSFAQAQYWVVGVGVKRRAGDMLGREVIIVDAEEEEFKKIFQI